MKKLKIALLILVLLGACENSDVPEDRTPLWLELRITELSGPSHMGTVIYRYDWNNTQIYHVMNPVSSCAYCELYTANGEPFEFSSAEELNAFLANRTNETIIWTWTDE